MRIVLLIALLGFTLGAAGARAGSLDPRALVERAVTLVESRQYALARVYVEPALLDYRLPPEERSRAHYIRGYSYFAEGLYASAATDYRHALEFDPGNPVVLGAAAQLRLEALGGDRNTELAVELFREAAAAGLAEGKLRLGLLYLQGFGVEKDLDEARRWLGEAADAGSTYAMLQLGQSWRAPWAEQPDPARALEQFERAHAAGEVDALAYAGFMYERGEFGEPDPAGARKNFEAAAAAGSALAQARLGQMHLAGEGAGKDPKRAVELFRAAAEQGHPAGFLALGYLYEAGEGVAADPAESRRWYEKAADAGVIDAQLHLAYVALRRGTSEGEQDAAHWLARAAAQSDPRAMNDYAWLLATSEHPRLRDGPRALTLARRAVDKARSPGYLDTLAAAYAEMGLFTEAIATQRDAIAEAPAGSRELVAELSAHLEAFEAGKPWRE